MPPKPYLRKAIKFNCRGIQLSKPPDALDEGYYLDLLNVRIRQEGSLSVRHGYQSLATLPTTPLHSMRLLNNPVPDAAQNTTMIIGAGTKLYTTNAALALPT